MTTYNLGPGYLITYGTYGRGEIVSGFITTDGILGPLQPQDILSWSLSTEAYNYSGLLHSETWGSATGATLNFTPPSLIANETTLIFDTHPMGSIDFYQYPNDPFRVEFFLSSTGDTSPGYYFPKYVRERIDGYGWYLNSCTITMCVAPGQVTLAYAPPVPTPAPLLAAPGLFSILLFTVLALRARR